MLGGLRISYQIQRLNSNAATPLPEGRQMGELCRVSTPSDGNLPPSNGESRDVVRAVVDLKAC
jgi:hypothetical protein